MPQVTCTAPREISYAYSARGRVGKAAIRSCEQVTGRMRLRRLALLINEFDSRVGGPLWVNIGKPLPAIEIGRRRCSPIAPVDYLRRQTCRLSPRPTNDCSYGIDPG